VTERRSPGQIRELVRAFFECTLPLEEWHHREHLTVACYLLANHPRPEALDLIRDGIRRFNEKHGIQQTPTGGYHETLTFFFMNVLDAFLTERGIARGATARTIDRPLELLVAEATERFSDKRCVLEHYSRDRINSWDARLRWVEPDLKALPSKEDPMTSRKDAAISFLKKAGLGDVKAAYDAYVAPDFKHHNSYFKGDRASLLAAMAAAHEASPNASIDVKHVYEDGDTVVTHSLVLGRDPARAPLSVVHIFRFKGDRVVELWDVAQEIPKDSPNENGPF
jgi:predicted SnoaL-like aldol condensation-catalyzing enzyme